MNKVVVNGVDCSPGVVAELRSRLSAAESRAERLAEALREIADDFKAYVEYRGKVVSEWGSYNRARRALEVKK